jgi:hypothetical protein
MILTDKEKKQLRKEFVRIFGEEAITRTEALVRSSGIDIDKIMEERNELRKRHGLPTYGAVFA